MVSEEEFTHALIAAVERYPVLYNVQLADYKNKNKKGEAFKSVQREIRQAGCSELQVQSTYKKWISLKRKFRVEYFRVRSEEKNKCGAVSSNFRYFDALSFLVPYCDFYEQSVCGSKGGAKRRKHFDYSDLGGDYNDEDHSEEDSLQLDEDDGYTPTTLDRLLMNKAKKMKVERVEHDSSTESTELKGVKSEPLTSPRAGPFQEQQQGASPFELNGNISDDSNVNTIMERLFSTPFALLAQQQQSNTQQEVEAKKNINKRFETSKEMAVDEGGLKISQTAALMPEMASRESQNALFGRLVASEMDKLPESLHNVVRAQVLLLLAQANNATANFNNGTSNYSAKPLFNGDKIFSKPFG